MSPLWRRGWRLLGAGVVAVLGMVAPVSAQSQPGQGSDQGASMTRPIEVLRAIRELNAAIEREDAGLDRRPPEEILRSLGRPARQVTPPALTPAEIDAMLDRELTAAKATPAPRTTDEEFLRRVCLDLTGKPPTPEQVTAFLKDTRPNRREAVVDSLLDTEGYAAHWGRYWRDVIVYRATNQQALRLASVVFAPLESWFTAQFAANRPWDEIATAIITASGDTRSDGPALFYFAHADQQRIPPVEIAGEVSRIFLGTQISCAQCHDHLTDRWKRQQFHEFAAFFAGGVARPNGQPVARMGFTIETTPGRPHYAMVDLKDPDLSHPIEPRFFLADSAAAAPAKNLGAPALRALAASYVTGQDNPWFARAFVNRMWAELVGEGFNAPIDDMGPDHPATYPEVLDTLANAFAQGGYDVKWLLRTITGTAAYQRAVPAETRGPYTPSMAANETSRLSAGQIYEALRAAGVSFDPPRRRFARARAGAGGLPAGILQRLGGPRGVFDQLFGVDPSQPDDEVVSTIPQALFLMNSQVIATAVEATPGTVLGDILEAHPGDDRKAADALYLRVLARHPTAPEWQAVASYLQGAPSRREGFEDLYWSLLNSSEFVSRK